MQLIPAILTKDPQELDGWLRKIRDSKKFERVQIDFIDGEYANNKTIKPIECDLIPYFPLLFDAHLMVKGDNVLFWGMEAQKMGFNRVYYQVETVDDLHNKRNFAVDLETDLERIDPQVWKLVENVIVLGVKAGFSGQRFEEKTVDRIRWVRGKTGAKICVDGGVEKKHLAELEELGVDEVAVGVKRVMEWDI